jgi:hypothetical protein
MFMRWLISTFARFPPPKKPTQTSVLAKNDEPSRSKAIRRLIEIALTVQTAEQLRRCTAQAGAFGIARHNRVDEDLQRCRFVQLFGS